MARSASLFFPVGFGLVTLLLTTWSCETGDQFQATRAWTSTVTLSRQAVLELQSPLTLGIEGLPRTNELMLDVEAVATASSATVAQELVDALEFQIEEVDTRTLRITGEGFQPNNGTITGILIVQLPEDMDLNVFGAGGPVQIFDMTGDITVNAITDTQIVRSSGDVVVRVEQGVILVESELDPGTRVDAQTGAGDVQLTLPSFISAQVAAQTQQGTIFVTHPSLPAPIQGLAYGTIVGGGLSGIVLVTGRGNILIQSGL